MTSQELTELVSEAIRIAAADLGGTYGKQELLGFALCTDDDVRTLYHVACTKQWVIEHRDLDTDIDFLYTEWMQSAKLDVFKSLSLEISYLADIPHTSDMEWARARDGRFQALAESLLECRRDNVFEAATFLCVGSTSPSKHMKQLAIGAVERLNSPEMALKVRSTW